MAINVVKSYPLPEFSTVEGALEWAKVLHRILTEGDHDFPRRLQKEIGGIKIRAYLGTTQEDIANTTWTTAQVNTESYDESGNFSTSTYKFTAPEPGDYLLLGQIRWNATVADKKYLTAFYKNTSTFICGGEGHASLVDTLAVPTVDIARLAYEDTVELKGYHNAGAATPDMQSGSGETFMAIHLLSR
jgi:hypothetical protein